MPGPSFIAWFAARRRPWQAPARAVVLVVLVTAMVALAHRRAHNFQVVWVIDGDTFVVRYQGQTRLVQLAGADAPEIHKNEPYALVARDYLVQRLRHGKVWLEFLDLASRVDYKQRLLCWAWIGDENLSYSLVAKGYARFSGAADGPRREILVLLERDARQHLRGLWADGAM